MRPERMRATALAVALGVACFARAAGAVTYASTAETFAWTDPSAHTAVVWTGAAGGPAPACSGGYAAVDDDISDLLPIGFTFSYAGVAYTQVRVMSNGRLQFNNTFCGYGTASTGTPPTYPYPYADASLLRTIRVYGADLDPGAGGSVRWTSTGTTPNREFIVTWLDVPEWNRSGSRFQLQVVLRENGDFVLRYGTINNTSGGKAEIGWENSTSDFAKYTFGSIGALANSAIRWYVPDPIAEYRFDESSWTGASGEIVDAIAPANNGTALGSASSTSPGKICRAGLFPANSSGSVIAAVDTFVTPGGTGTLTFWARIDTDWEDVERSALADASFDGGSSSGSDRMFQVQIKEKKLSFRVSNASGNVLKTEAAEHSFGAGAWHHIGVTWNFAAGRLNLWVDGVLEGSYAGSAISMPSLASLWIGDGHDAVSASDFATRSAGGAIDEVRLYGYEGNTALVARDMAASHACPSLAGFALTHDGYGIHCLAESVSVRAVAADGSTVTDYTGTTTLDTQSSRGTWQGDAANTGSFTDVTADDGLATYRFATTDLGVARFWLTYRAGASPLDVDVYESTSPTIRDGDTEGSLAFGPSGFVVTASPVSNPPPLSIDTSIPAQTAGVALSLYLTAYGQTPTDPECGVIETYQGTKTLGTWSTAVDPTTQSVAVSVNGTSVGTSLASATNLAVAFTSGQAAVSVRHDDVGKIGLSFRDAAPAEPAGGVQGSSASFVVRPASFVITSITRVDGSANPGASTPGGAIFVKAGVPFAVTLEARNASGARTPSYGTEVVPENVELRSASLVAPAGGRNGSSGTGALGGGTSFSATTPAGTFRNTGVSFDEVGAITLSAHVADGSYLGAGDVVGSASATVGRFTPDHFDVAVAPVAFATGCRAGRFTYVGQSFDYATGLHPVLTVDAKSLAGTSTANYTGTFFRLVPATLTPLVYAAATGTLSVVAPNAPRVTDAGGGRGTVTFDQGPALSFVHDTPVVAFAAEIGLSVTIADQDAVAYAANPLSIGTPNPGAGIAFQDGNEMRWGRLVFENAYGAEVRDLPVPLRAESFDGLRFVPNTADTCTSFAASSMQLAPTPASLATPATVANQPFAAGDAGLSLRAPGAGNTGSVALGIDLSPTGVNLPFLRFDWDGDGTHDDDPGALATFGVYRGNDATVDLRERY